MFFVLVVLLVAHSVAATPLLLFEIPSQNHHIQCEVQDHVANCSLYQGALDTGLRATNVSARVVGQLARQYRDGLANLHSCATPRTEVKLLMALQAFTTDSVSKIWAMFGSALPAVASDETEALITSIASKCAALHRVVENDRLWDLGVGGMGRRRPAPPTEVGSAPAIDWVSWFMFVAAVLFVACFVIAVYRRVFLLGKAGTPVRVVPGTHTIVASEAVLGEKTD